MTETHTPGPWEWGPGFTPGDSTGDLFGQGGKQVIASASYENMWLSTYDEATDAANARLIAAAPELLEAVLRVRALVSEAASTGFRWEDGDWSERLFKNQAILSSAIAKATGQ